MSRSKEEVIDTLLSGKYFTMDNYSEAFVHDAMDEYADVRCLDLLEYLAKKGVMCCVDSDGVYFKCRGEVLTKEQIFENFL